MFRKALTVLLVLGLLSAMAGCARQADNGSKDNEVNKYTKAFIESSLNARQDIFNETWAPDKQKVLYIEEGKTENNGLDKAFIWRVGDAEPKIIRDVKPVVHGLAWSPDSSSFLISEKLGEGAENIIIKADTLQEYSLKPKSMSIPVWSPDGKSLAYGNEMHDYGDSWGSLEVYTLGQDKSEYIWKAMNYLYKVQSWDAEGNIGYIEVNPQGQETEKSTKNIRPDISGVHLGDTKDQVKAALGTDYTETPPGEETIYFPEKVYRWDYEKGYKVFIGEESGKVIEMLVTDQEAVTNLGIKMGDTAARVFEVYRPKYIEPESVHGGKLYGLFKVEGAAALYFSFDLKEGASLQEIKSDNKVIRMTLTYPELLDDSF